MKNTKLAIIAAPLGIVALAGTTATAQSIDGTSVGDTYPASLVSQNAAVIEVIEGNPLALEASWDNSNVGGVGPIGSGEFGPFPAPNGDPAGANPMGTLPEDVTTGIEIVISRDEITNMTGDPVRIVGFIHQGLGQPRGSISNQFFGNPIGFPVMNDADGQPLGESDFIGSVDFNDIPGDQFITAGDLGVNPAPVADGTRDASYGAPLYTNTLATSGEDNTDGSTTGANGSEINAVYAVADATNVYIFIAGNIRTNPGFQEKITLFFDNGTSSGQGTLDNRDGMGGSQGGTAFDLISEFDGLVFDTGFTADYMLSFNGSDTSQFIDVQDIPIGGGGSFSFYEGTTGTAISGDGMTVASMTFPQNGGPTPNGGSITVIADNSNTQGVVAAPLSGEDVSDPELVDTGFEFKIEAEAIGIDPMASEIKIGGWIAGTNFDFLSNQVLGNLPEGAGNLGNPANQIDFSNIAGEQFVRVAVPAMPAVASITIDGTGDEGQYTQGYVNFIRDILPSGTLGVGTGFGDNDSDDPVITTNGGSEINNASFFLGLDPDNDNKLTLYGFIGGNLETNNNQFALFIDGDDADGMGAPGQNQIRNDNAEIAFNDFNTFVGGDGFSDPMSTNPGMTWDTEFDPDFVITYNGDGGTRNANGAQLLSSGGGFGGNFFSSSQPSGLDTGDPVPSATGTLESRTAGFGDNSDPATDFANGSELNNITATRTATFVVGDGSAPVPVLNFFIGGNLETNANKIEIFVDSISGGQNTLIYDDDRDDDTVTVGNPVVTGIFDALNRMGGPTPAVFDPMTMEQIEPARPGFTFDAGFEADYYYTFNFAGGQWFGDYGELSTNVDINGNVAPADIGDARSLGTFSADPLAGGFSDSGGELVRFAVDNSNVDGVDGAPTFFGDVSGASAVNTGFEISIPFSDIGLDPLVANEIKLTIFINGTAHDFVSNQFLAGACINDLGEPREVNLESISGPQFVQLSFPALSGPFDTSIAGAANTGPASDVCEEPDPTCPNGGDVVGTNPTDIGGNGTVDVNDLLLVLNEFGNMAPDPIFGDIAGSIPGDGMPNGVTDVNDLLTVLNNFGLDCDNLVVGGS